MKKSPSDGATSRNRKDSNTRQRAVLDCILDVLQSRPYMVSGNPSPIREGKNRILGFRPPGLSVLDDLVRLYREESLRFTVSVPPGRRPLNCFNGWFRPACDPQAVGRPRPSSRREALTTMRPPCRPKSMPVGLGSRKENCTWPSYRRLLPNVKRVPPSTAPSSGRRMRFLRRRAISPRSEAGPLRWPCFPS